MAAANPRRGVYGLERVAALSTLSDGLAALRGDIPSTEAQRWGWACYNALQSLCNQSINHTPIMVEATD